MAFDQTREPSARCAAGTLIVTSVRGTMTACYDKFGRPSSAKRGPSRIRSESIDPCCPKISECHCSCRDDGGEGGKPEFRRSSIEVSSSNVSWNLDSLNLTVHCCRNRSHGAIDEVAGVIEQTRRTKVSRHLRRSVPLPTGPRTGFHAACSKMVCSGTQPSPSRQRFISPRGE